MGERTSNLHHGGGINIEENLLVEFTCGDLDFRSTLAICGAAVRSDHLPLREGIS